MAEGLDNSAIARRLGIGVQSVRTRILHVRWRLGLDSREELVAWVAARSTPERPDARLHRVGGDPMVGRDGQAEQATVE